MSDDNNSPDARPPAVGDETFAAIFHGTHDGVLVVDVESRRFHDANPSICRMLGYSREELLTLGVEDLHPADSLDFVVDCFERAVAGRLDHVKELPFKRKDGSLFFAEVSGSLAPYGGKPRLVGFFRDITDRRRAEETLRANEEVLRQLTDSIHEVFWLVSPDWRRVFYVSPAYEKVWGRSRDSLMVNPLSWLDSVHVEDRPRIEAYLAEKDAGAVDEIIFPEYRVVRPDGSIRWMAASGYAIRTPTGEVTRIAGLAADITQRKEAEKLMAGKEAAEIANHAKSQFLASMSHELRTPMHAILSFASLAEEKLESAPPERLHRYLERILLSGNRLLVLLDDLLDLSKLEAGRMRFHFQEHDLAALARAVAAELSEVAGRRGVAVEMIAPEGSARAVCDGDRICQVLRNLLANAIKFTPEGARVRIHCTETLLAREGEEGARAVSVVVEDEGVGIPEEELDSVFDKFVQSSKHPIEAGGTGLGLAICKEIVDGHGGEIWAENNAWGGATFTFVIPREGDDVALRGRPGSTEG